MGPNMNKNTITSIKENIQLFGFSFFGGGGCFDDHAETRKNVNYVNLVRYGEYVIYNISSAMSERNLWQLYQLCQV